MFFDEPVSRLTVGDELVHRLVPVVRIDRHVLASALSGAVGQKIDRVSHCLSPQIIDADLMIDNIGNDRYAIIAYIYTFNPIDQS